MPPPGIVKPSIPVERNSSSNIPLFDEDRSILGLSDHGSINTRSSSGSGSSNSASKIIPRTPDLFDYEGIPLANLLISDVGDNNIVEESLCDTAYDKSAQDEGKNGEPICEVHKRACKKGICKYYARQLRELEIAKNGGGEKGNEQGGKAGRGGRGGE